MAKILQREQAQRLRREGKSIRDIARIVEVSKSTASYWCRDIPLSARQRNRLTTRQELAGARALLHAAERKRKDRLRITKQMHKEGREDIKKYHPKSLLFGIGLGLYWGEGYKSSNGEWGFTNSDPQAILLIIRWLEEIYGVSREQLTLRVSINQTHKHREETVLKFWSEKTNIPVYQFTKTSFISAKSQKVYTNPNNYFGTLRVKVKSGANLKRRILGTIAGSNVK